MTTAPAQWFTNYSSWAKYTHLLFCMDHEQRNIYIYLFIFYIYNTGFFFFLDRVLLCS
jgi:hypothetical protein